MTAPFVATVTKPTADSAASRRLRRALLALVLLICLLLACVLLTWLLVPGGQGGRADWLNRLFHHEVIEDPCTLPMVVGPCRGGMQRFHFDSSTGTCRPFLYGGCEGNANNFETKERCADVCGEKATGGDTAEAGSGRSHRQDLTVCSLPAEVGDCRAAIPRFHFDIETSECKEFTYGGCGGNGNNFQTLEKCQQACQSGRAASTQVEPNCSAEPDPGLCMAYMERFAFNPTSGECEMFVYGGCGSNGNNYKTKALCEERCKSGSDAKQSKEDAASEDHDTEVCGVDECPADCGFVRKQGDCLLCQCSHQPFLEPGEVAVSETDGCPSGYSQVRRDFSAVVCARDPIVPTASP